MDLIRINGRLILTKCGKGWNGCHEWRCQKEDNGSNTR